MGMLAKLWCAVAGHDWSLSASPDIAAERTCDRCGLHVPAIKWPRTADEESARIREWRIKHGMTWNPPPKGARPPAPPPPPAPRAPQVKLSIAVDGLGGLEARTAKLHAQWAEIGVMVHDHKDAAALCGQVAKLDLAAGDTVVVMMPGLIGAEQRPRFVAYVRKALGRDVPVLVLDGGATIAQVHTAPDLQ